MEAKGTVGAAGVAAVVVAYRDVLRLHQEAINRLNVYPVPDGDTGTNMALTMEAVVAEIEGAGAGATPEMVAVCKAVAHGSLMGARGNSGVILSQLLRGLTGSIAGAVELDGPALSAALTAAGEAAYLAVLRPVEGTILTVARVAAEGGARAAADGESLVAVLEAARAAGGEALAKTPEQLPVLAQAGVVDAGGTGYLLLLDSFLSVVDGRPLPEAPAAAGGALSVAASALPQVAGIGAEGEGEGSLRYEVMYLLEAADDTIAAFKEVWAGIGDSIVVVGGEGLWNCHIHTNDVGPAIEAAVDAGRPRNIRVTDLTDQVEEERWVRESVTGIPAAEAPAGPPPRTAVVAVATGEGIGRIFWSLGVHNIVPGGQSMNPSTAQILEVVEALPSPEVVLLPNNDNIHPVANQVCELAGKPVRVVPTSGIVEGFAALLEFDPQASAEENAEIMAESARRVVAGEVAQAVRDATGPAGPIAAGDWMGISRDGVEVVCSTLFEATCGLLGKLLRDDHELVTLIEGEGAGAGETRRITEWVAEHRPSLAVEVHHGGQPFYPYLISIE
ncbi:MAG TPA: DAK2 domain-containing protein [Acidimicrobiales bacterium]|nr:DAK2 domain-containing protein [Acidimicrobiales bacterium]